MQTIDCVCGITYNYDCKKMSDKALSKAIHDHIDCLTNNRKDETMETIQKNNTRTRQDGNTTIVTLYDTDIVRISPDVIALNTGGYNTATTKRRINEVLSHYGIDASVYVKAKIWYVMARGHSITFNNTVSFPRQ